MPVGGLRKCLLMTRIAVPLERLEYATWAQKNKERMRDVVAELLARGPLACHPGNSYLKPRQYWRRGISAFGVWEYT